MQTAMKPRLDHDVIHQRAAATKGTGENSHVGMIHRPGRLRQFTVIDGSTTGTGSVGSIALACLKAMAYRRDFRPK